MSPLEINIPGRQVIGRPQRDLDNSLEWQQRLENQKESGFLWLKINHGMIRHEPGPFCAYGCGIFVSDAAVCYRVSYIRQPVEKAKSLPIPVELNGQRLHSTGRLLFS